jgi:hypothetical protein
MPDAPSSRHGKRLWLVTVAVGRYADASMPNLPGVPRDANRLAEVFGEYGAAPPADFIRLYDEQATRDRILGELQVVADRALLSDQVVIWFGGHGHEKQGGDSPMPDGMTRYLLPFDAAWETAAPRGISTGQLAATLAPLRASEVVVILDCCHSGGLTPLFTQELGNLLQGHKTRYVLAAARPIQLAMETDSGSPLTQSFCDALEGQVSGIVSEDGYVSAGAAAQYARDRVLKEATQYQHKQEAIGFEIGGSICLTRVAGVNWVTGKVDQPTSEVPSPAAGDVDQHTPLPPTPSPAPRPSSPSPSSMWLTRRQVIVPGAVLAVAIMGGGLYYAWNRLVMALSDPGPDTVRLARDRGTPPREDSLHGAAPVQGLTPNDTPALNPNGSSRAAPIRYRGRVDVLVERDKRLLKLNQPGALPLRHEDKFRIEGEINPPAYVYVVWVDPGHDVTPVSPWDAAKGWGSRPAKEDPTGSVSLPPNVGDRYTAPDAKPGVATIVLLASPTPLDIPDPVLEEWFKGRHDLPLPPGGEQGAVWFDDYLEVQDPDRPRTFQVVGSDDSFARWQGQLQKVLGARVTFETAVSFARTGGK